MKCKAFEVTVELEIQAITCPGVWLCPNGKLTLQIYMLGCTTQTSPCCPMFPLIIHEKFTFQKIFYKVRALHDLENLFSKEDLYAELIQWENCSCGNVLATFKTSLADLLYPPPYIKGLANGEIIDLLMEGTKRFPGIISPKIEVSTRTTIEEILCRLTTKNEKLVSPTPKVISSKWAPKRQRPIHQKKVCHSYKYHIQGAKKCLKPKYDIEFSTEDILPCPKQYDPLRYETCSCISHKNKKYSNYSKSPSRSSTLKKYYDKKNVCPICTKYKEYFDDPCICYNTCRKV